MDCMGHDMSGVGSTTANAPLLSVNDLTISWQAEPVLNHIAFKVSDYERLCFFGKSGVGKSTLFHVVAGLNQPDTGEILLRTPNQNAHKNASQDTREKINTRTKFQNITAQPGHISYMFQQDLLFPEKTVLQNCALPLILSGTSHKDAYELVQNQLKPFGLKEVADKYPRELSGGMLQRAALLRTSLTGNNVVLMDEPFSALDAFTKAEVQSFFLEKVAELGLTILFITHDISEAQIFGTRAIIIAGNPQAGRASEIIADTTPQNLPGYLDKLRSKE